jgi:acetolactate synthase-1/2/3 large subunit
MTAADVVADGVRRARIPRVFITADGDPILSAAISAARIPLIFVIHAASAITMASVTGQLGEAPGLALIHGDDEGVSAALAAAARARAPMIVLAPHAPGVSAPVVKTTVVASADSAAHWPAHSAQAAMSEPPGPVWLVVPAHVASRPALPLATAARRAVIPLDATKLDAVAQHLAAAARPLIVAGRECRAGATAGWLRALAEALPAPVLVTPAARGVLPDPHPLCFGALSADAAILGRADLVLALGVDADELARADVAFTAPVVRLGHTAAWEAARGVPIAETDGDVAALLEELASRLRDRTRADWDVAEVDRLRRARPSPAIDGALAALVTHLREATPAGTVAVFQRDLAPVTPLWLTVSPGELLVDDLVVPAAIGAALERPRSPVLAITRYSADTRLTDLSVAVEASARVIVIALDAARDDVVRAPAGVRTAVAASSSAVGLAIGQALAADGPSVIAVPPARV